MPSHLLFLDLETTGLDPHAGDLILEVAAIAVHADTLNEVWTYHRVVDVIGDLAERSDYRMTPRDQLRSDPSGLGAEWFGRICANMHVAVCEMHSRNGLLGEIFARRGAPLSTIETDLAAKIATLGPSKGIVIAGNSPGAVDVPFLKQYAPKITAACHYHTVDVSGLARELDAAGGPNRFPLGSSYPKSAGDAHRALDDAKQSLGVYWVLHQTLETLASRERFRLAKEEQRLATFETLAKGNP